MKQSQIKKSSTFTLNNVSPNYNPYQKSIRVNDRMKSRNLTLELAPPFHPHTIKQKLYNKPRPAKHYERFIPTKIALTGVDPSGNINEFISNDIIPPLRKPDLYNKTFTIQNTEKTSQENLKRWALRTTAKCNDLKTLPKLQPFTSYYFPPKYNNKDVAKYRKFSLKTDHIGIQVPRSEKVSPEKSFIKLKSDFYFNTETKTENEWIPFFCKNPINNVSSQNYDIINFKPIFRSNHNPRILDKTLYNKKKGIGEFCDLTKTFGVNFNKEFGKRILENPLRFRRFTGIFSDMYDSSHKNGDISPPFERKEKRI